MRRPALPRLPLALVAVLVLVLAGIGCGGDDEGDGGDAGDARALLERAFAKPVKSGDLELDMKADLEGGDDKLDKPITLKLTGPYQLESSARLPRLDWKISFSGLGQKITGGLIATADNGFLEFQGQAYELGEQTFASLARQYGTTRPGRSQGLGGLGVDPTTWLEDPQIDEDGGAIGGEPTRKISGSVDVRKAAVDIVELTRSPRLRRQLERQGQPTPRLEKPKDEDLDELEDAIEKFDIEVNVDRNDVVRRFFTEIDFDVPEGSETDDVKGGSVSLSYVLQKVNTNPVIRAPQNPKPLQELLGGFGLGALGGGLGSR